MDLDDALEFAQADPPVMETVGYILYEVNDPVRGWVAVTDTLGGSECSSVHKIPYVMIVERHAL